MASTELSAIVTSSHELIASLSTCPVYAAEMLINKKVIPKEALDKILSSDTPRERAAILVEMLKGEVESVPEKFSELLMLLSELPCCEQVLKCLQLIGKGKFCYCITYGGRKQSKKHTLMDV